MAILVGFGSGHALQQRYWRSGWKYTLLDGSAIGLMSSGSNGAKVLGVLGLVIIRVVEGVDVLDRPYISEGQVQPLQTGVARLRPEVALFRVPVLQTSF